MVFGQIGYLLGYSSIYITAALSIFISMLLYIFFLIKDRVALQQKG